MKPSLSRRHPARTGQPPATRGVSRENPDGSTRPAFPRTRIRTFLAGPATVSPRPRPRRQNGPPKVASLPPIAPPPVGPSPLLLAELPRPIRRGSYRRGSLRTSEVRPPGRSWPIVPSPVHSVDFG